MAPSLLWHCAEFIQDYFGNAIPGATVTVIDRDTGAPIAIYKDGAGVNRESNPLPSSESGFVSFYAGPRKSVNLLVASAAASFTIADVAADTVEAHRQAGDHDAGTITADQLAFEITNPDLAVHVVQESNTHGLASNEYFACTKAGAESAATSSPTFADVTVDSLDVATGGLMLGSYVCDCDRASIVAAIAAASDGDTILIKGRGDGSTPQISTASGTITIDKGLVIKGLGFSAIDLIGANPLFTISNLSYTMIENLSISRSSGAAPGITITNSAGVRMHNVVYSTTTTSVGTYGIHQNQDLNAGFLFLDNCIIDAPNGALRIDGSTGGVYATRSYFTATGTSDYGVALIKGGAEPDSGHSFTNCVITGAQLGLYVDTKNCKFLGCYIKDESGANEAVNVTANGTSCYLPTNANTVSGAITDSSSNIVGNAASWDYDSTVTIDNNGATYEDEYFVQSFTHNLGTRHLECLIEVANTSGFNDKIWTFSPQLFNLFHATTPPAAAAASFSICHTADNTSKLLIYAGRSRDSGGVTASKNYIFNAIDPTALVAAVNSSVYQWAEAGGYALNKIWLRLRLRRA